MAHAPLRARVAFAGLVLIACLAAACGDDSGPTGPTPPRGEYAQIDLRVGTGADALPGRTLTVHYTGWLYDPAQPESKGRQFESSVGGPPYSFPLGAGRVIRGWDQGVVGMRVGGLRRLILPPELAYGSTGQGAIPPNATLVFEVEVLAVQ